MRRKPSIPTKPRRVRNSLRTVDIRKMVRNKLHTLRGGFVDICEMVRNKLRTLRGGCVDICGMVRNKLRTLRFFQDADVQFF